MYNINAQKNLAAVELKEGLEGSRSWHHQYRHSAYIYVGGLHPGLSEGDIVIVFSQFGEIVDCHMVRDKTTGKPKGFAYICYDDQRSTNLAVDNMSGFQMLKRTIRVDHCEKFKAPKQFDENDLDENGDAKLLEYKATGAEGKGYQIYNELDSQKKLQNVVEDRQKYQDDRKSKAAPEDEDEAWARSFEDKVKVDNEIDNERFDFSSSSRHQNNVQCSAVKIQEDITGYWSCRNIQKSDFQDSNFETTEVVCSLEVTGQILFTRLANYWSAQPIGTQRILSCCVRIFQLVNHPR